MNSGEDCDTRKNDNNPLLKPARYKAAYGGRGSATTRKPKFDRLLPTVPPVQMNAPGGSLRRSAPPAKQGCAEARMKDFMAGWRVT